MHLVDITMFYAPEGGGVSTYLNAKARWLARHSRVRHTILSPNVQSRGRGRAPALVRIPAVSVPGIHGYRMPLSVAGPARQLQTARADLVEAGDAGHCAWAALRMQQQHGVPAVAFYHSDLPRLVQHRLGRVSAAAVRRYLAHLYRRFDLVLAPSRLMVEQLADMGVPDALHQPLGIDSGVFRPDRRVDTLREHLHLAPNARLLVYAGRFTPEKKLHVLIDAVRKLGRPYHLVLIGGGTELPRYPQITYVPFKRDQRQLARLLASCDVLVHPGDCETFGLIVLEAMACGLPVVGTSGGGVAELVDAETGILAEPNSVDSLAAAIEAIYLRDLAQLGINARRKAQDHYDWDRVMPQLMQRYGSLVASAERAALEVERICVTD
ncbi:glycosyltransferase family 1 protein [Massilia solisilvae]|uniref:Glycosyltransferase family 1 protein n=1 Tax=Massilia solisilvae TaxID=1811225 RepID=A0ABT2BK29_9BURK|nr:glycosyltransferase family 1 protein [Massilia solisilvae]MCS0608854.1 glycosyltransferase family 1 protein [Massilia solisilvae]